MKINHYGIINLILYNILRYIALKMGCSQSDDNKKPDLRIKKPNVSISHVKKRCATVGIFGKCNAGKTSLYNVLSGNPFEKLPLPTLDARYYRIPLSMIDPSGNLEPCDIKFYDLPGIENKRVLWKAYANIMDVVIYAIDTTDKNNLNVDKVLDTLTNFHVHMKVPRVILVGTKIDELKSKDNKELVDVMTEVYTGLGPLGVSRQMISSKTGANVENLKIQIASILSDVAHEQKIPKDRTVNIILVGKPSVGKTTFFNCALKGKSFSTDIYEPTMNVDMQVINVRDSNDKYKHMQIRLWDTAGQEKFNSLTNIYFNTADIILFFHDAQEFENYDFSSKSQNNNYYAEEEEIRKKYPNVKAEIVYMKSDLIKKSVDDNIMFFTRNNPQNIKNYVINVALELLQ